MRRSAPAGLFLCFAVFASAQSHAQPLKTVRPEPAPGPIDNPLKGWCPYSDYEPISLPYSMVYTYVSWKTLEPREGVYAFEDWEKTAWNEPAAAGKHIVFRVFLDYPSQASGLPDWLRAKGVKETRYREYGGGRSPDYEDDRLVAGLERLIAALGKRYDEHPRVAFIEMGLLGYWGEWHTYPSEKLAPSRATEERVIRAFHAAFRHKILLNRYARDGAGNCDWLGFHDDMFPEDTDNGEDWSFLAAMRRSGRVENWKRAAIGGEMVPNAAKTWLSTKYQVTAAMVDRAHFSWVGPYCPALVRNPSPEFRERADALVRRMGYEYRIVAVRHPESLAAGGAFELEIEGENQGVAPFYYPWRVEARWLDAAGKAVATKPVDCDIRRWLPGPFKLDVPMVAPRSPGRYRIVIGIIDPMTGEPSVRFANRLENVGGWTALSSVDVAAPR